VSNFLSGSVTSGIVPVMVVERLKGLEWKGGFGMCQFCGNFQDDDTKSLPDSMRGHLDDCRFVLELRPRIAYLMLKGE